MRGTCPECSETLANPESGTPWCPACQWNLDVFDPVILPPRGWKWIERRGHDLAFRLDKSLLREYTEREPTPPGWTRAHVFLVAFSAFLTLLSLGAIGAGITLIAGEHQSMGWVFAGIGLIAFGLMSRPRLGRAPKRKDRITRAQA